LFLTTLNINKSFFPTSTEHLQHLVRLDGITFKRTKNQRRSTVRMLRGNMYAISLCHEIGGNSAGLIIYNTCSFGHVHMLLLMFFQFLPTLEAFCPFCSCPGVNNFLLSLLLIVFALCPSFNGLALGRGMRDSNGANVLCFLSSLLLYFWVLLPVISLLLINTVSPLRACLIIRWERFRGTQKEDDRGPLGIQSSVGDRVGRYAHLQVI
jgi:hypothetical protein